MVDSKIYDSIGEKDIAVIGMSGRFPKAGNLKEFWQNLKDGKECVTFFTDEELIAAGVEPEALRDPSYVKAALLLDGIELFDASFFGYTPREAAMMDPQQRFFLETAWEALEDAGYVPGSYKGYIGVYAGAAWNTYLLSNLCTNPELFKGDSAFQVFITNDKDYMPTRVSYKLNMKGPSMIIQTACSTSLVAIHMAALSLLNYECDIALAGGSAIKVPNKSGYYYQQGGLASPDGHCRAFDADAKGTVFGSGVGAVVLKRALEAIEDRDNIYAIIKGSAINNDGSLKVSYTAPSVEGQAEVIAAAQAVAGVEAESIGYIETHGTGTSLGDPIEVTALTKVFRESTDKNGFCAIGSVKTNVGHLDSASGVAGFIKTVLSLKEGEIPPSLNYNEPNPKIDFDNSPFFVNNTLRKWNRGEYPLRAGVSSFGVGGTNAHVILEEAPPKPQQGSSRPWQLLVLSAKTEEALINMSKNLACHLKENPGISLADAAYTLQTGRTVLRNRRVLVSSNTEDAVKALEGSEPLRVLTDSDTKDPGERNVVFMFTGQGSQYINMAIDLYKTEKVFKEQIDLCCKFLKPHLGIDLKEIIYPLAKNTEEAARLIVQTNITQPALFVIEYSLARLFMDWGIRPAAMIGHSIGEYTAACIAGVMSLNDALRIVAKRGSLMQGVSGGCMMAVYMSEKDMEPFLGVELSMAAVNAPGLCVVSGPEKAIERLEEELGRKDVSCRRLQTSHAFHSWMMDPVLNEFEQILKGIKLNLPEIPYISNVTGTWITGEQAVDPGYWVRHLRGTVRFADGIGSILEKPGCIPVEIGPGRVLCTLAKQCAGNLLKTAPIEALKGPNDNRQDTEFVLNALGKLWLAGVDIDWQAFYKDEERQRISLPTYPFERQRYWIEPAKLTADMNRTITLDNIEEWIRKAENIKEQEGNESTPSQLHPRPKLQNAYVPPENELEKKIEGIWAKAFGFEEVGVYDNFFELGGDSFVAVQVINMLKKELGMDIPAVSLYQGQTIKALAETLGKDEAQLTEERAAQFKEQKDKMEKRKQLQKKKRSSKMGREDEDDE